MMSALAWNLVVTLLLNLGVFLTNGLTNHSASTRPDVVNIGAIFSFDSTIGRVAKVAIEEAVKDVNANSTVLHGTELRLEMLSSNCNGFLGMVGAPYVCSHPDMIKLLQFPWSFSNLVEVDAQEYDKLLDCCVIFPCKELLNLKNLEKLSITDECSRSKIEEVFKVVEGTNDDVNIETQSVLVFEKLKEVTLNGLHTLKCLWKSNRCIVLNFPNLTKVSIEYCPSLKYVFTSCMVGSLLQLQELQISKCRNMEVIVKEVEDSETSANEVVFPCLQSITLHKLQNLKGFCLGKEAFQLPSLDILKITECPKIEVLLTVDLNSFIKTKQQEGWQF